MDATIAEFYAKMDESRNLILLNNQTLTEYLADNVTMAAKTICRDWQMYMNHKKSIAHFTVAAIGILFNTIEILVFCTTMKDFSSKLLCLRSISDLGQLITKVIADIVVYPVLAYRTSINGHLYRLYLVTSTASVSFAACSPWLLVHVTYARFGIVCDPLKSQESKGYTSEGFILVHGVIVFILWYVYTCCISWSRSRYLRFICSYVLVTSFLLPLILVSLMSFQILQEIRKARKERTLLCRRRVDISTNYIIVAVAMIFIFLSAIPNIAILSSYVYYGDVAQRCNKLYNALRVTLFVIQGCEKLSFDHWIYLLFSRQYRKRCLSIGSTRLTSRHHSAHGPPSSAKLIKRMETVM